MKKYLVENVSHGLKEWRQLHLMKVIGLLACAFIIIPSANAVDALKTCACLLKECRYLTKISYTSTTLFLTLFVLFFV